MIFRAFNLTLGSDFFTRGMSKPTRSWQVFCPFQVESIQIKSTIHHLLTSSFRIKPGVGVSSEEVPFVTRFLSLIVFFVAIFRDRWLGFLQTTVRKDIHYQLTVNHQTISKPIISPRTLSNLSTFSFHKHAVFHGGFSDVDYIRRFQVRPDDWTYNWFDQSTCYSISICSLLLISYYIHPTFRLIWFEAIDW